MAELLGIVAGGAGLASLSIQLLESASKVERFCARVVGAPKRLSRLANDIRTLSLQLKLADTNICYHDGSDCAKSLGAAIQQCRNCADDIVGTIQRLEGLSTKWRGVGRISVAFKDTELRGMCDELESGKSSLLIAIAIYSELRRRQDADQTRGILKELYSSIVHIPQARWLLALSSIDANSATSQENTDLLLDGTQAMVASEKKRATDRKALIRIKFSAWLTNRIWCIGITRAEAGWDISFRTLNVVPRTKPIFTACELGDLMAVRQLLAAREASVHDTAYSEGEMVAPLQIAAERGHDDICQLLLRSGRRIDQWSVSHCALGGWADCGDIIFSSYTLSNPNLETMLLEDLLRNDDFMVDASLKGSPLLRGNALLIPETARFLKTNACYPFADWPLVARAKFGRLLDRASLQPLTFLQDICELPATSRDFRELSRTERLSVLSLLLETVREDDAHRWLDVAQTLSEGGNEAFAIHFWLTRGSFLEPDLDQELKLKFQLWLQVLRRRGVDLWRYGRAVEATWTQDLELNAWHYKGIMEFQIQRILHGSRMEDWALELVSRREVPISEYHRPPASWPEPPWLPLRIWGPLTTTDELRGHWLTKGAFYIFGTRQILAVGDDRDAAIETFARLEACTRDDCTPGLLTRRRAWTETRQGRRARSQPPNWRCLDRPENVVRRYSELCKERIGYWVLWHHGDLPDEQHAVRSAFDLIRVAWQRRLKKLCDPVIGVLGTNRPRERRRGIFSKQLW